MEEIENLFLLFHLLDIRRVPQRESNQANKHFALTGLVKVNLVDHSMKVANTRPKFIYFDFKAVLYLHTGQRQDSQIFYLRFINALLLGTFITG